MKENVIKICKFRNFETFYKQYTKALKRYGKESDFIIHFRLSTHGTEKGLFNVHPFRISEKMVFAHNGMLYDVEKDIKKSDTQIFNETILQKLQPDFLKNRGVIDLLEGYIGSDKLVFLKSTGKCVILNENKGHWINGGWFSKTTKDRMNEYFNDSNLNSFGVFQKKGDWFVLTPNNDHKNALPYENDMTLEVA